MDAAALLAAAERVVEQIISYADRFPAAIDDAVRDSKTVVRPGSPLLLAPIPQLIALKFYAGKHKSKADIFELLIRSPELDFSAWLNYIRFFVSQKRQFRIANP